MGDNMGLSRESYMALIYLTLIYSGKEARCIKCGSKNLLFPTHFARNNGKSMLYCKCNRCNSQYYTPLSALKDIDKIKADLLNVDFSKELTFTNIFAEKTYICV